MTPQKCSRCGEGGVWWDDERPVICNDCRADGHDYCQVCNRELPHPPYTALAASGMGDCIGAIIESLASGDCPSDYGYNGLFMCALCGATDDTHEPSCLWRRAVEAMKP